VARKIRWSDRARRDRLEILEYWANRNKSKTYSKKLNQLFKDSIEKASRASESGTPTQFSDVRFKIVRDYLLFYNIQKSFIEVIAIWDSNRNPERLKL
jgi:addiction module RelE/StbE family toxin